MGEVLEETLGQRIVASRIRCGVTQAELARTLGISSNALVDIEKDRSIPRSDRLRDIARELRVSMDYLMGITGAGMPFDDVTHVINRTDLIENLLNQVIMAYCSPRKEVFSFFW